MSVVIPCYCYGRYLTECVDSVLGQDGVDVSVLVIDDASPDDSAEVAERLAAADPRVEVRRHSVNRGHIATYNEGLLEWAAGDYSVLLSADDLLTPGSLRRATAVLEAHPEVGFVYGHGLRWNDRDSRPSPRLQTTGVTIWPGQEWLRIVCRLGHSVISSPEVVVRTSLQQMLGGYRADLPHTGDAEMWMRFAVHAAVAFVQGVDQAYYRAHGTNMTTERVATVDLRQRKAAFDAIFDTYTTRIAGAERLRRRVDRGIAREALWEACREYDRGTVDGARVADLRQLARSTYPRTALLPESLGLRWRRRLGPGVSSALSPVSVSAARRRLQGRLWWWRWKHRGV